MSLAPFRLFILSINPPLIPLKQPPMATKPPNEERCEANCFMKVPRMTQILSFQLKRIESLPTFGEYTNEYLASRSDLNQRSNRAPAPALRASLDFPTRSGGRETRAARSDNRSRWPPIFSENRGGAEGEPGGGRSESNLSTFALSPALSRRERGLSSLPLQGEGQDGDGGVFRPPWSAAE